MPLRNPLLHLPLPGRHKGPGPRTPPFFFKHIKNRVKNVFTSDSVPGWEGTLNISLEEAAGGGECKVVVENQKPGGLQQKTIQVKIPPGLRHLERIQLKHPVLKELSLQVLHKPHPFFRAKGGDIIMDLPVSFTRAVLGGRIEVPTLKGVVSFELPEKSHSGHTIRLKNQGFPATKTTPAGDHLVVIRIDIPKGLTEQDIQWVREIDKKGLFTPAVAEFHRQYKNFLRKH